MDIETTVVTPCQEARRAARTVATASTNQKKAARRGAAERMCAGAAYVVHGNGQLRA